MHGGYEADIKNTIRLQFRCLELLLIFLDMRKVVLRDF